MAACGSTGHALGSCTTQMFCRPSRQTSIEVLYGKPLVRVLSAQARSGRRQGGGGTAATKPRRRARREAQAAGAHRTRATGRGRRGGGVGFESCRRRPPALGRERGARQRGGTEPPRSPRPTGADPGAGRGAGRGRTPAGRTPPEKRSRSGARRRGAGLVGGVEKMPPGLAESGTRHVHVVFAGTMF